MSSNDRLQLARDAYRAYETSDRDLIEGILADDLTFYSPPDPGIDRTEYFERCWPNAGQIASFEFVRLIESGDEVVMTRSCCAPMWRRSFVTCGRNSEVGSRTRGCRSGIR